MPFTIVVLLQRWLRATASGRAEGPAGHRPRADNHSRQTTGSTTATTSCDPTELLVTIATHWYEQSRKNARSTPTPLQPWSPPIHTTSEAGAIRIFRTAAVGVAHSRYLIGSRGEVDTRGPHLPGAHNPNDRLRAAAPERPKPSTRYSRRPVPADSLEPAIRERVLAEAIPL